MRTGFYIVGILKGYKSSSFTNRETGEVKDRHNMGFNYKNLMAMAAITPSIQEIKIDDRSMNDALRNTINRLKDKTVMVLAYPREWAMENGRKGITYNFDESSNHRRIEIMREFIEMVASFIGCSLVSNNFYLLVFHL